MNSERTFFEALLDPEQPPPAGLTTWNGSDPAKRFAVYRNNVTASLIDALADTYPVTQELVGEEFFRAMARIFVRRHPPRSRVLAFYGESLPGFIEDFPPAAAVPYLADVARLEIMRVRAYHAADQDGLAADVLAQHLADPERLPYLQIALLPWLGLLRSRYAVVSLWAAHQGISDISQVDPGIAENALIVRPGLDVEVIRLDPGDSIFVEQVLHGEVLGVALEQASLASAGFDPTRILALLIQTHAISTLKTLRDSNS